jgi:hypothetical protein
MRQHLPEITEKWFCRWALGVPGFVERDKKLRAMDYVGEDRFT